MIEKKRNKNGQKAYQRTDYEDRSLSYRMWLRTIEANGFFMDVDMIKWKSVGTELKPVAITDLTRCDGFDVPQSYLDAVLERFFVRDNQGKILTELGRRLQVPVYLILFQKDMIWLWVYSFSAKRWKKFTRTTWGNFLKKL